MAIERVALYLQDAHPLPDGIRYATFRQGDGVSFIEEQHGALLPRQPEDGRDVFGRFSHPHRLELGVADDQQPPPERVRDRFGADGFPRA